MTVRRPSALLLALCLGALSSFAIACGEDTEGLITSSRAADLQEALDRIDEDVASGKCEALSGHLDGLRREIGDLPGSVDRGLRQRLREGLEDLERDSPEECRMGTKTTETEPETVPETIPEETVPEEIVPPEVPEETTPPPTTPQETTPAPETPPETVPPETPPGDSGGEEAPLGDGELGDEG